MRIAFDYTRLRERIESRYRTHWEFARAAGLSKSGLSGKLSGKIHWSADDMYRACMALGIPLAEISRYFFNPKNR